MTVPAFPWSATVSGREFSILNPDPELIHPWDIIWALSRLPRFTGHTRDELVYSVGQHSCLVHDIIEKEKYIPHKYMLLAALLHDAEEYILNDVSNPVKRALEELDEKALEAWSELSRRITQAIWDKFNLPVNPTIAYMVKRADQAALWIERPLLTPTRSQWVINDFPPGWSGGRPAKLTIWDQERTRREFTQRLTALVVEEPGGQISWL